MFGRAGIADGGTGNPNFSAWTAQVGSAATVVCGIDRARVIAGVSGITTRPRRASGALSPTALFGPRDDQAVEMYYRYHLTPFIEITPDVQWVSGVLGGLTNGDDAVIAGIRMNIILYFPPLNDPELIGPGGSSDHVIVDPLALPAT